MIRPLRPGNELKPRGADEDELSGGNGKAIICDKRLTELKCGSVPEGKK